MSQDPTAPRPLPPPHVYRYVCVRECVRERARRRACACVYVCMYAWVDVSTGEYMWICTHIRLHTPIDTSTHAYMHTYTHAHTLPLGLSLKHSKMCVSVPVSVYLCRCVCKCVFWQISGFFSNIQIQTKTHRTKYDNIQNTHIHAQGRHSLLDLHCNKSTWIVYANYRALLTVSR